MDMPKKASVQLPKVVEISSCSRCILFREQKIYFGSDTSCEHPYGPQGNNIASTPYNDLSKCVHPECPLKNKDYKIILRVKE